jgi:GT2 family glycosyltransferase
MPIFGPCAAAALYRAHVLEDLGGFDEFLFVIHEDSDLAWRTNLLGYRALLALSARVVHKRGISGSSDVHHGFTKAFFSSRNNLFLTLKYYPLSLIVRFAPSHLFNFGQAANACLRFRRYSDFARLGAAVCKALRERKSATSSPAWNEVVSRWVQPVSMRDFLGRAVRRLVKAETRTRP